MATAAGYANEIWRLWIFASEGVGSKASQEFFGCWGAAQRNASNFQWVKSLDTTIGNLQVSVGVCSDCATPMIPTLNLRTFCAVLVVVPILCVFGMAVPDVGYTQKSVGELIDDLTQIDSQSPGINSAAI